MGWLVDHIDLVLVISGIMTCSMIIAITSPRFIVNYMFNDVIPNEAAQLLVRSWGTMVVGNGLLLIYAAYDKAAIFPILVFVGATKLAFAGLVFLKGKTYLHHPAAQTAVIDTIMAVLFFTYLAIR